MKNLIVMSLMIAAGTVANADGFVCTTQDGAHTVKVYDKVQPSEGTRNAAVMILSDNRVQVGNKTIARFQADNALLSQQGATYVANVDLRFADSARKGELVGGTKLGNLQTITLDLDFSFAHPVASGEEVGGQLILEKRDGSSITVDVTCERYLKN